MSFRREPKLSYDLTRPLRVDIDNAHQRIALQEENYAQILKAQKQIIIKIDIVILIQLFIGILIGVL